MEQKTLKPIDNSLITKVTNKKIHRKKITIWGEVLGSSVKPYYEGESKAMRTGDPVWCAMHKDYKESLK